MLVLRYVVKLMKATMLSTLRHLLLAVLVLMATQSIAATGDWTAMKATKQVAYTLDNQNWIIVKSGDVIPNRAWVSTGPRGRLQMVRGSESITFQPNTTAAISTKTGLFSRQTQVAQHSGTLDLEIETRGRPHTTVQTPFLAAVVKGTGFRVTVGKRAASVTVRHGLVEVTSNNGERSNVGAGQSAKVSANKRMEVAGATSKPTISDVIGKPSLLSPSIIGKRDAKAANDEGQNGVSDHGNGTGAGKGNGNGGGNGNGNGGGNGNGNGKGKG